MCLVQLLWRSILLNHLISLVRFPLRLNHKTELRLRKYTEVILFDGSLKLRNNWFLPLLGGLIDPCNPQLSFISKCVQCHTLRVLEAMWLCPASPLHWPHLVTAAQDRLPAACASLWLCCCPCSWTQKKEDWIDNYW